MGESARTLIQNFLLSQVTASGRWKGGCESRLLESGLALRLLGTDKRYADAHRALEQYCEKKLSEPEDAGLESVIPRLVAQGALARIPPREVVDRARSLSSEYRHFSHARKKTLMDSLLAASGLIDWSEVYLPPSLPQTHRWISLLFQAFHVLRAAAVEDTALPVDNLLDAQSADGSWDQHVLVTIFVLLSLTAAGASGPALDKGCRFLMKQQRDDGGLPFISNEDTWVTCLGSATLAEAGVHPARFASSVRYLRRRQRVDGGWAYAETVEQSDADDTALCLSLLSRVDAASYKPEIDAAVRYLTRLRNADGGFPTFVHGADAEVEITAKALVALRDADPALTIEQTRPSWDWLRASQDDDGGFAVQWNACETFPVLHVVDAIHRYGIGSPENQPLLARCADFLLRLRLPEGGWPMTRDSGEIHPLSTAYALAALARCGPELCPAEILRVGTRVLLTSQPTLIADKVVPDSLGPRPFPYSVPILTPIYTLNALTRLREA